MPAVAARLDDLMRSHESTKKLHDSMLEQYQRANLQIDIERLAARSRFEVVTPPYLQAPTSLRTFGIRGIAGLILGLMIVGRHHRGTGRAQTFLPGVVGSGRRRPTWLK